MSQEFNENPFMATTPVCVFSSGMQADSWFQQNCCNCINQGKCELERIMLESDDPYYCVVPLHIAKRIGVDYNPLYQQGSLHSTCKEKRAGDDPF